jgi:hypothetical protein
MEIDEAALHERVSDSAAAVYFGGAVRATI